MSLDTPKPNVFTEYDMTQEEQLHGQIFNSNQLAVLRNQLAATVQQRVRLEFDASNVIKFSQDEAFLKGQISILELLLDTHNESMAEIAAANPQY